MLALPQSAHDANNDKLDTFIRLKKAGEGTYGVVYKCKDKITGKLVALKRIKLNRFENRGESEGIPSTAIREICLLKGLHHASVVELLDVIISDDIALHIVFEYLDMDLKKYLDASVESLPQDLIKSYMKQLMEGLAYLHSHRILHRDLKPQNLLLDREGHIKLADFGLSRAFSLPTRTYTHEVVTLWYRAPELLLGARIYSTAVDVWSVGCIMGEMVGRRPMFPGDSEIDQLYRIFRVLGTPTEESWKGVTRLPDYKSSFPQWEGEGLRGAVTCQGADQEEFIKTILLYDTIKRATARECLKMDYFKTVKLTTPNLKYFEDD